MIRLSRVGARKQPHYRIVVIEKDRARNGRSVEVVGTYNPRTNPASVLIKRDRVHYWTSNGAQLSERVTKLMAMPETAPEEVSAKTTQAPKSAPKKEVAAKPEAAAPVEAAAAPTAPAADTPAPEHATPAEASPEPVAAA